MPNLYHDRRWSSRPRHVGLTASKVRKQLELLKALRDAKQPEQLPLPLEVPHGNA